MVFAYWIHEDLLGAYHIFWSLKQEDKPLFFNLGCQFNVELSTSPELDSFVGKESFLLFSSHHLLLEYGVYSPLFYTPAFHLAVLILSLSIKHWVVMLYIWYMDISLLGAD